MLIPSLYHFWISGRRHKWFSSFSCFFVPFFDFWAVKCCFFSLQLYVMLVIRVLCRPFCCQKGVSGVFLSQKSKNGTENSLKLSNRPSVSGSDSGSDSDSSSNSDTDSVPLALDHCHKRSGFDSLFSLIVQFHSTLIQTLGRTFSLRKPASYDFVSYNNSV